MLHFLLLPFSGCFGPESITVNRRPGVNNERLAQGGLPVGRSPFSRGAKRPKLLD